jgi:hypothetical protein
MKCMPESSRCYSVYSVVVSILVLASLNAVAGYTTCTVLLQASLLIYCTVLYNGTHETIELSKWILDCYFFLLSDYRNIEYRFGEF